MNITAIDILNILNLQSTGYQVELEKYAKENKRYAKNLAGRHNGTGEAGPGAAGQREQAKGFPGEPGTHCLNLDT